MSRKGLFWHVLQHIFKFLSCCIWWYLFWERRVKHYDDTHLFRLRYVDWAQQSIFANMSTKVLRIFFFNFGRLKQPKSKNLRVKDFTDSVSEQFPLVWNPLQQGEWHLWPTHSCLTRTISNLVLYTKLKFLRVNSLFNLYIPF